MREPGRCVTAKRKPWITGTLSQRMYIFFKIEPEMPARLACQSHVLADSGSDRLVKLSVSTRHNHESWTALSRVTSLGVPPASHSMTEFPRVRRRHGSESSEAPGSPGRGGRRRGAIGSPRRRRRVRVTESSHKFWRPRARPGPPDLAAQVGRPLRGGTGTESADSQYVKFKIGHLNSRCETCADCHIPSPFDHHSPSES